jgi:hypothetical protein
MSVYCTFVPRWCKIKLWRFFLHNMCQIFINHILCLLVGADISTTEQIAQATLDTNRPIDGMSTTHLSVVRGLVIRWFVHVSEMTCCSCVFVLSLWRVGDEFRPTTFTQYADNKERVVFLEHGIAAGSFVLHLYLFMNLLIKSLFVTR